MLIIARVYWLHPGLFRTVTADESVERELRECAHCAIPLYSHGKNCIRIYEKTTHG